MPAALVCLCSRHIPGSCSINPPPTPSGKTYISPHGRDSRRTPNGVSGGSQHALQHVHSGVPLLHVFDFRWCGFFFFFFSFQSALWRSRPRSCSAGNLIPSPADGLTRSNNSRDEMDCVIKNARTHTHTHNLPFIQSVRLLIEINWGKSGEHSETSSPPRVTINRAPQIPPPIFSFPSLPFSIFAHFSSGCHSDVGE